MTRAIYILSLLLAFLYVGNVATIHSLEHSHEVASDEDNGGDEAEQNCDICSLALVNYLLFAVDNYNYPAVLSLDLAEYNKYSFTYKFNHYAIHSSLSPPYIVYSKC